MLFFPSCAHHPKWKYNRYTGSQQWKSVAAQCNLDAPSNGLAVRDSGKEAPRERVDNDNDNDTLREVPHPSNEGLALQARV